MEGSITVVVIPSRAILVRAEDEFTICGADGHNCNCTVFLLHCVIVGVLNNVVLDEVQCRPGSKLLSHWRECDAKNRGDEKQAQLDLHGKKRTHHPNY